MTKTPEVAPNTQGRYSVPKRFRRPAVAYRTEVDALAAIELVKDKPGFAEEGKYECAEYELNRDYWSEGFVRGDG